MLFDDAHMESLPESGLLVGSAVTGAAVDAVIVIGPGAAGAAGAAKGLGTDWGVKELNKI